jgi:type II secretory pathway pseudopilin PulG
MNSLLKLRQDRGIYLTELMVSITILSVVVLGLTTVLLSQARQMKRDKLLNDIYVYADILLSEAEYSFGAASDVIRGTNSGGRAIEELEFNFAGTTNLGRKNTTRFTQEGDRRVAVSLNGQALAFAESFPPPHLDPEKHRDLDTRLRVKHFKVKSYQDRTFLNPRVSAALWTIELTLVLDDMAADYKIERDFRRVVFCPNKPVADARTQNVVGG